MSNKESGFWEKFIFWNKPIYAYNMPSALYAFYIDHLR